MSYVVCLIGIACHNITKNITAEPRIRHSIPITEFVFLMSCIPSGEMLYTVEHVSKVRNVFLCVLIFFAFKFETAEVIK